MYQVDLNCDLGESYGAYTIGMDGEVLPFITSANVACGFHASDPLVMEKTVKAACENHVAIGAHPGYPDLMGFGRRNIGATPAEVKAYVIYQVGALAAFCKEWGIPMQHVKPHGAMYNMAGKDYALARAICEGIAAVDSSLILLAPVGSEMMRAAQELSLPFAREVFADRAYEEDGSLVPRSREGAMIEDEDLAVSRVIRMIKEGKVTCITGKEIPIQADSVCVHGDGKKAVAFVKKIRVALEENGIAVAPFGSRAY